MGSGARHGEWRAVGARGGPWPASSRGGGGGPSCERKGRMTTTAQGEEAARRAMPPPEGHEVSGGFAGAEGATTLWQCRASCAFFQLGGRSAAMSRAGWVETRPMTSRR